MNYKEILGKVHDLAHLSNLEEAVQATRTTLEVFGKRLTENERKDLGAQLPEEIAVFLESLGEAERFGVEELYKRVNQKDSVDFPETVHRAQAVIAVLSEAVSAGEMDDIKAQLPDEFDRLFNGDTIQE